MLWRARACLDVLPGLLYLGTNHVQMFHLLSNICDIWAKVPSTTLSSPDAIKA